ncbi:hypothetical protein T10_4935 [Trichinella papuae]|uniref:Uncharacterized protein n=1 Tax=Trichinella papuae TaxID=268474 RepID=A0A0V1MLA0_9BILA|nr:hypothetical protein T10_4935 [Trichinella papuae]
MASKVGIAYVNTLEAAQFFTNISGNKQLGARPVAKLARPFNTISDNVRGNPSKYCKDLYKPPMRKSLLLSTSKGFIDLAQTAAGLQYEDVECRCARTCDGLHQYAEHVTAILKKKNLTKMLEDHTTEEQTAEK